MSPLRRRPSPPWTRRPAVALARPVTRSGRRHGLFNACLATAWRTSRACNVRSVSEGRRRPRPGRVSGAQCGWRLRWRFLRGRLVAADTGVFAAPHERHKRLNAAGLGSSSLSERERAARRRPARRRDRLATLCGRSPKRGASGRWPSRPERSPTSRRAIAVRLASPSLASFFNASKAGLLSLALCAARFLRARSTGPRRRLLHVPYSIASSLSRALSCSLFSLSRLEQLGLFVTAFDLFYRRSRLGIPAHEDRVVSFTRGPRDERLVFVL